jgi:hypothetical protein
MPKYIISINYDTHSYEVGDSLDKALLAYDQACLAHPGETVTLIEDEEMIKEREILGE